MDTLKAIAENLVQGKAAEVKDLVEQAIKEGKSATEVLNEGMLPGMGVVGGLFKEGKIFLPEVLFAARAMKSGMEIIEPLLVAGGAEPTGTVVIGTVKGDIHDIGKGLVGVMLKGNGFDVFDLGNDTPPEKFVEAAKEHNAHIVAMSVVLGTAMPFLKSTIDALAAAGLKGKVKALVGGPIVTQSYADEIGADGYAPNAAAGADKAKELIGK